MLLTKLWRFLLVPAVFSPTALAQTATDATWASFADNGAAMPSPDLAVGPAHVVATVAGELGWFSKATGQRMGGLAFDALWPWVIAPQDARYARAIYNATTDRYYVAALWRDGADEYVALAVSDAGGVDDSWFVRRDRVNMPNTATDYISIGVSGDGLYVSFDYSTGAGSWALWYTNDTMFNPAAYPGVGQASDEARRFAANAASGAGDGRMILTAADSGSISRVRINGRHDSQSWPWSHTVCDIPWQSDPPAGFGTRDFQASCIVGESLWLTHTITNDNRAVVRWYEINLNGWPNSGQAVALEQHGSIDTGANTYTPAIAADAGGNAVIVCSSTGHAVIRAVRFPGDPTGEFRPPVVLATSSAPVPADWGAFYSIDADPTSPGVFWSHTATMGSTGWQAHLTRTTIAAAPIYNPLYDLNGDGAIDTADATIMIIAMGTNNPVCDLNNDGVVDTSDLAILIGEM